MKQSKCFRHFTLLSPLRLLSPSEPFHLRLQMCVAKKEEATINVSHEGESAARPVAGFSTHALLKVITILVSTREFKWCPASWNMFMFRWQSCYCAVRWLF